MPDTKELFVGQEHWDQAYTNASLFVAPGEDLVRKWLERHFGPGQGSCLELGCFPGRYLAVFGELGYEINGIDLTPRVDTDLKDWMRSRGYRVGEFIRADVSIYDFKRKFDVVCSFGLIEHFRDWPKLLRRHAALVQPNGFLAVSCPNFRGFAQQLLHRWLDAENLSLHNLDAMVPSEWADVLRPMGFEILHCGCFGPFDFWAGPGKRNLLQKITVRLMRKSVPIWRWLPATNPAYAPYCALVARRSGD